MSHRIIAISCLLSIFPLAAQQPGADAGTLKATYDGWRRAIINKDARNWQSLTAAYRQAEVRNRLVSEKRPFPAAVFQLPAPPPTLDGLKLVHFSQKGPTAKTSWFGKVDFGIGGDPTDNLLVLTFIQEAGRWKYDRADFVNLAALPDVRNELADGNLRYVQETPECQATGIVPPTAAPVPPAKYIAKVYVFSPGREVNVQVNQISRHRFANAKEAEVVMGGARDGQNQITYTVKTLEGGTGKEALAIRVYLMSQIPGTKPIIAFERVFKEGETVKGFETGTFAVDPATAAKLVR
jgi:hypothetical protein